MKIKQLVTALKHVDDAIQNPEIREMLINDPDVGKMGEIREMLEQAEIVEFFRHIQRTKK